MSLGLGNIIVQQKSSGGAGAGNLQAVTDIGNTTTNNIELLYPDEGTNSLNFRNENNIVGVNKATLEIDTNEYLQLRYNIYGAFATTLGLQFGGDKVVKTYTGGLFMGLYLDFDQNTYMLGDYSNAIQGTHIIVDDNGPYISTNINGGLYGLLVDTNSTSIGDFNNNVNNTWLTINDTLQRMEVSTNLVTSTAGSNTTQHLSIYVGGVHYKIQLKNP